MPYTDATEGAMIRIPNMLARFEPMYKIGANPTRIHFSSLLQFCVKKLTETTRLYIIQSIPSPFICVDFFSEVGLVISPLPTEQKSASGRQK